MATASKIILAICSSGATLPRSKQVYNTYWKDRVPSNIQIVLVYDGPMTDDSSYMMDTEGNMVLNERSHHLPLEMFRAIRTQFPTMAGCFKCDDTVIPNVLQLQGLLDFLGQGTIDYLGKVNPESGVCGSSMYYLSRRAIVFLDTLDILNEPIHQETEILIADHLRKQGISPDDYHQLYSDSVQDMKMQSVCLHPYQPVLYVKIDGGIGNQLFQIASAYGMAKRAGMEMAVIAYDCHSTHIQNPYDYFQTILKHVPHNYHNRLVFPQTHTVSDLRSFQIGGNLPPCQTFQEPEKACWSYIPTIVEATGARDRPVLLKGYFQNLSYFREYQDDIRAMFLHQDMLDDLTKKYTNLDKSYFLHIRRGDYVNNHRYWIDADKYYRAAMDHILAKDPDAHFYIFSNDIGYCKQYHVLGQRATRNGCLQQLTTESTFGTHGSLGLCNNKTFVENLGEIESLYLMTLCQRGGICANSTYSWWGAYLNNNPEKTVVFPRRWFNLPGWPFDEIFLEDSVVLDA
jgi:Glycosyl transferase family 11